MLRRAGVTTAGAVLACALFFPGNAGAASWQDACQRGIAAFEQERYLDARRYFEAALAEAPFGPRDLRRAQLDDLLAHVVERLGDSETAECLFLEAEAILERDSSAELWVQHWILSDIGWFRADRGQLPEAAPYFERALAAGLRAFGEGDARTATARSSLGQLYAAQGRFADAEGLLFDAVRVHQALLPAIRPERLASESSLGILYTVQGQYSAARLMLQRASDDARQLGELHPKYGSSLLYLADLSRREGNIVAAGSLLARALAIFEASTGPDSREVAATLLDMSVDALADGKATLAESETLKALGIFRRSEGVDHPVVALCEYHLAKAWIQQGRYAEAESLLKHALIIQERAFPNGHTAVADTQRELTLVEEKLQKPIG